jgi:hypothetical protein
MKMTTKLAIAAGLAVGATLALATDADAKRKSCTVLGGKGTGITNIVATDQALWQLEDAAKAYGGKVAGKAKTSCAYQVVVSECTVTQRYCK